MAKMPPEILEMIFGMVNFVDLPSFLLVCKWINVHTTLLRVDG